jgi:hypothetical protein
MKEAWSVEHRHSTHQGRSLDDLLSSMALGVGATTLDLSGEDPLTFASGSGSSSGGRRGATGAALDSGYLADDEDDSPGASFDEDPLGLSASAIARGAARGMVAFSRAAAAAREAVDSVAGSHILPVYPGQRAAFAPVCKHVPTLEVGRMEGYQAMQRLLVPALGGMTARARRPAQVGVQVQVR